MIWRSDGYDTGKMPRTEATSNASRHRDAQRGNIALVTALLVMALAGVGIGIARFVQMRAEASAEMRLSNYAATLAQNVAESGLNQVIFNWNASLGNPGVTAAVGVPGNAATGPLTSFPSITTSYPGFSGLVTSDCTYTVAVADAGANWTFTVVGTVTSNGTVLPSLPWRTISRTIEATASKTSTPSYSVSGYLLR